MKIIVQCITGQLQKNYGEEDSEIIVDNCQLNIFGGFAPASQTAVEMSKAVYMYLRDRADAEGKCWPTQKCPLYLRLMAEKRNHLLRG